MKEDPGFARVEAIGRLRSNMRRPIVFFVLIWLPCFFLHLSTAHAQTADPSWGAGAGRTPIPIAALVDGTPIAIAELKRVFNTEMRRQGAEPGRLDPVQGRRVRRQILDQLIDRQLLLAHLEKSSHGASEAEVEAQYEKQNAQQKQYFEQFKKAGHLPDHLAGSTYEQMLAFQGSSPRTIKGDIRYELGLGKLREHVKVSLTGTELRREFSTNKRQYIKIRASHIQKGKLRMNKAEAGQALAALKEIEEKLSGGYKDFGELARDFSDCPSKVADGDLGVFGTEVMFSSFERVAFGLKVGDVSDIIRTPFGYHIIKVTGRQDDFGTLQEDIRNRMTQARLDMLLVELRDKAVIEINPLLESPR